MRTLAVMISCVVFACGTASAVPASEQYARTVAAAAAESAKAEANARAAEMVRAATNGIPESVQRAREYAAGAVATLRYDSETNVLAAANRASEALSRSTVALDEVTSVSSRVHAVSLTLDVEAGVRANADAGLSTRVGDAERKSDVALARANAATNTAKQVVDRIDQVEVRMTAEAVSRASADTALGTRIDAKQDRLPYPTNAIPASAIATNTVASLGAVTTNASGVVESAVTFGSTDPYDGGHIVLKASESSGNGGRLDAYSRFGPATVRVSSDMGGAVLGANNYDPRFPLGGYILVNGTNVMDTVSSTAGRIGAIDNTVNAWQTYWDGDDVRVTVTNYYGQTGTPHLYIEEKMPADETHESTWFKVVWDELTRWDLFLTGYAVLTNDVVQNKADRAWGVYDSSTGSYSPDGVLQISQGTIYVANGMAYQKTIETGGEVWVLTANDANVAGNSENGFFKIKDGDGNSVFEVVKGDKRTVGATAASINVGSGEITIGYNVVAEEHPKLMAALDLNDNFVEEYAGTIAFNNVDYAPSVSWTGSSGAYVAHVTFGGSGRPGKCFFKASYEVGGETYIKHTAPISAEGGILCTDGIHKVRPVYNNGNVTWEVVQ